LLSTTPLNAEQRGYSDVLVASAKTLLTLIENVLDISAIEAGKLKRQATDFAVADVVNDVEKILSGAATDKGLRFEVSVAADVPHRVSGDSDHLRQILINLTANAIKFTEAGRVSLSVSLSQPTVAAHGATSLRFSVRDTGIGIPVEAQSRIFQAFEQADRGHGRRYGGSGLGTSIAKALTDLAGGTIGFQSTVGQGSHFWVDIPFAGSSAQSPAPASPQRIPADKNIIAFDDPFVRHRLRVRSLRILIADDVAANRMVLQQLLRKAGHDVISASGGEQVLDLIAEDTFDLAIIDLHMPDVSGLDVLKQTRFMQSGSVRTPMIVLSADATPETFESCKQAGAYAFLTKPIVNADLLTTVARIADREAVPEPLSPNSIAPKVTQKASAEPAVISWEFVRELEDQLDADFFTVFVKQCLRDAYRLVGKLEESCSLADWDPFRDYCHALKGVAAAVGAEQLADSAAAAMKLGNLDLPEQAPRRVARLREQFQNARKVLVQKLSLVEDRESSADGQI
jgi:two-component system sensor histidine kinase RpfC